MIRDCIKPTRLIKPEPTGGRSFGLHDEYRPKRGPRPVTLTAANLRTRCDDGDENEKTAPNAGAAMIGGKIQSA